MYPVMLDVRGRRCLVVGGGEVALRKVEGLLAEGARLTVVAEVPASALEALGAEGTVDLERRAYRPGEAAGFALVIAATDDRSVNRRVSEDAGASGIWVNVADDPELCTFQLPARVRRGALQLAVASEGEAPFAVRRLRQLLERRLGPAWEPWLKAAGRFRARVRELSLDREGEEARFDAFFAGTVDGEGLSARVPTEAEEAGFLAGGEPDSPEAGRPAGSAQPLDPPAAPHPPRGLPTSGPVAEKAAGDREPQPAGLVSLVGAGPGDAGLLTLRARQRLLAADAVVYDRLAETALPCDLPETVELFGVGKQADHHPIPQDEINALLVSLARRGLRVVRLKGGDPFVFGRGGEEALELVRAGIPFEVVPSVTAGVAAPAYAGIPVTHRNEVVSVTIVTAHEADKLTGPQVRWDLLAGDPHATLLGYMGMGRLRQTVERLLAWGMNPRTPAAVVERGTTSRQRVVRAEVARLPEAAREAGLKPPGLLVVGPTVDRADQLDWFGGRPLSGQRLVLAAPAGKLGEELELAGAEVVETPLPPTPAARVVLAALPLTGCLLRNAREVEALDGERDTPAWTPTPTAWCLGRDAAERARQLGWMQVEELEEGATPAELLASIAARPPAPA